MTIKMTSSVRGRGRRPRLQLLLLCLLLGACSRKKSVAGRRSRGARQARRDSARTNVSLTNGEWEAILSPLQFYVMRRAGTERPSNAGNALEHRTGLYVCSACGNPLFDAATKFDSGTGWPSFWQPSRAQAVHASTGDLRRFRNGNFVRALRLASRPCLQRWPAADRPPLLHERGRVDLSRGRALMFEDCVHCLAAILQQARGARGKARLPGGDQRDRRGGKGFRQRRGSRTS